MSWQGHTCEPQECLTPQGANDMVRSTYGDGTARTTIFGILLRKNRPPYMLLTPSETPCTISGKAESTNCTLPPQDLPSSRIAVVLHRCKQEHCEK